MTTPPPHLPAAPGEHIAPSGEVTLINSFAVAPGRDEAFLSLWRSTSDFFAGQPGFRSLRLHGAVSPDAPFRFVNVAAWASFADFSAAHALPGFRDLVSAAAWREFPNTPSVFEVITHRAA